MEISSVPPSHTRTMLVEPPTSTLDNVLKGQEKLMTKLSKLEAAQQTTASRGWQRSDGQRPTMAPPRNMAPLPDWSPDDQPRCFACNEFGHMGRTCPRVVRYSPDRQCTCV